MKLYLVIQHDGPDYQKVVKIYKSHKRALLAIKDLKRKARRAMRLYTVEEHVIIDR
jgi:hypothetical protein